MDRKLSARARTVASIATAIGVTLLLASQALIAQASTAPGLGTAQAYAILAGTPKITNTGPSVVSGSVGIHPAAAVVGFPPCTAPCATLTNGTIQAGTPAAGTAKSDLTTAYGVARSSPCNFNKTGTNLGGLVLTPGTYCQTTAPTLTGVLTLSGNGVFIFQVGSTLITAPGAKVVLINGAQGCNVFWQVSSSATLDTTTSFVGTIMALTDVHLNHGAALAGRALAQNGTVTLDTNTITRPATCNAATVAGPSPTPTTPALPAAGVPPSAPDGAGWPELTLVVLAGGLLTTGLLARRQVRARRHRT
jgi:hypothetical protein